MNTVKFIGLDVHKKTITIAIADQGRQPKPRVYGAARWFPPQAGCILYMKLAPAATASTGT